MSSSEVPGESAAAPEAEYRRLLDRSLVPVCIHDGLSVRYVNPVAARALGAESPADIVDRPITDFLRPASRDVVHERLAALRTDGDVSPPAEVSLLRVDGAALAAQAVAAVRIRAGVRTYEVSFSVTADAPEHSERRLRAVLDLLHDGVVIMGHDGHFQFTNKAARQILRSGADDLVGMHHSSRGVDLPMFDVRGEQLNTKSHPLRWILETGLGVGGRVVGVDRVDGSRVWVTGHGCLMDPDDPENSPVLLSFTDITELHDARERLLHDATHDWLTGLPNRGHALDQGESMLSATGAGRLSAVLFIDLDRLKAVNDSHGHQIGDEVLRSVARRMRSVARAQDLVARIGGDEFVVLLLGAIDDVDLDAIATRLHDVLAQDIVVGSLALRIGASIGITTVSTEDARSIAEVLRDADAAMYRAKAQGRANTARFEPGPGGGDRR